MNHKEVFTKRSAIIQPLFEDEIWEEAYPDGPQLAHLSLSEYMLVLSPPDALWKKIMAIKKAFSEAYNYPLAGSTKPHITLANFLQFGLFEERLQEQLQKITTCLPSVEVGLKDYASFSFSAKKAIYINITSKEPVLNLIKELKRAKRLMIPDRKYKPRFTTNPHLTIARGLQNWRYEKAWINYQQATFSDNFLASQITLLRRPLFGQKFTVAGQFDLLGKGTDQLQQGVLF